MRLRIIFQLVLGYLIFAGTPAWGQKNYWIEYDNNISIRSQKDLKETLKINKSNTIINIEKKTDELRVNHHRYKQYAKGYPIEGVSFIKHQYPSGKQIINGLWIKNFNPKIDFTIIPESKAIEAVENHFGNKREIAWSRFDDQKPKSNLVWYDKEYRKEAKYYRLAYKVSIIVSPPYEHYNVFVDARTGLVFHKYKSLNCANHPAKGVGFYTLDTISFVVDSIAPDRYEMKESGRNDSVSIVTQDALKNYAIISSTNNIWEDKAAVESHWGAEKTVDYYYEYHGRNSLDDKGLEIKVNVHAQDPLFGGPMANAFWDGESLSMNIGDGVPGSEIPTPLSSLDIIAHEFTHGVTQFSANLIYEKESGAINESMSDIFGITIEHLHDDNYNWVLGDKFNYVIRRMDNPKFLGMPAYYKGEYWDDEGDVHDNSAVGNLWYYYLVEGGSGVNEKGVSFKLDGLGFEKAAKIAYRCLTVYLTESSDYPEFREASIKATEDLFGSCSEEVKDVSVAWHVVGLGEPIVENDLISVRSKELTSGCSLGMEDIITSLVYRSCSSEIAPGTTITLNYSINNGSVISEDYKIEKEIKKGDTINYLFKQKANLSELGNYTIKTWVDYASDEYHTNDSIEIEIENRLPQNEDFKVVDFSIEEGGQFCGNAINNFDIKLQFLGCDSLEKGTEIPIIVSLGDSALETSVVLENDIFYFDTANLHVEEALYADGFGEYTFNITVDFPQDTFVENNSKSVTINLVELQSEDAEYKFEEVTERDNFIIYTGEDIPKEAIINKYDNTPQDKVILFEGGEVFDSLYYRYIIPIPEEEEDIWTMNPGYESKMCKCVDAANRENMFISFDYNIGQSYSWGSNNPPYYEAPDLFSAMRILVNDSVITSNYYRNDNFENSKIDLSKFVGQEFNLCFQMKTLMGSSSRLSFGYYGDYVKLDNIKFYSKVGIDEKLYKGNDIKLQPNPISDLLTVNLSSNIEGNISFEVFDVSGKKVFSKEEKNIKSGENSRRLDLSFLKPGFYVLKTKNKNTGMFSANKFVKR